MEDRKFVAGRTSRQPIVAPHGGFHALVSFAIEDGGRLGGHAQALMRAMAMSPLAKHMTPLAGRRAADSPHPMLISLWV